MIVSRILLLCCAITASLICSAEILAAEQNDLGVRKPRPATAAEISPRNRLSRNWHTMQKYEQRAEEARRAGDFEQAAGAWGTYYGVAEKGAAVEPDMIDHSLYSIQTLVALYSKWVTSRAANVESLTTRASAALWSGMYRFQEAYPGPTRTRLAPGSIKLLEFYIDRLETRESGGGPADWPLRSSFQPAFDIRKAVVRMDASRASQFWKLELIYVQSLCRFIQTELKNNYGGRENLDILAETLKEASSPERKSAGEAYTADLSTAIDTLEATAKEALKAKNQDVAEVALQGAIGLIEGGAERPGAEDRALRMTVEIEKISPGSGKQLFDFLIGKRRALGGPAAVEDTFARLEQQAEARGLDSLTLIVRNERREEMLTAGNFTLAMTLDLLTIRQYLTQIDTAREPSVGLAPLAASSARVLQAMQDRREFIPTDERIELLIRVGRVYADRINSEDSAGPLLVGASALTSREGISDRTRLHSQVALARFYSGTDHLDWDLLEQIRTGVRNLSPNTSDPDAAEALYFAACAAEHSKAWDEVQSLVARSLAATRAPDTPSLKAWQLEQKLMLAAAVRHVSGASAEKQALQEAELLAAECAPEMAPALTRAIQARLSALAVEDRK